MSDKINIMNDWPSLGVRVDPEKKKKLDVLAKKTGRDSSKIIRMLIDRVLADPSLLAA